MESTSQDGGFSPFFNAGMAFLSGGNTAANQVRTRHHSDTDANCAMVRVTGWGKALRMDFEEVFVSAEVMYHVIQRPINFQDMGALRASANSCAFSLTLPCLLRNLASASLTLRLDLCPYGAVGRCVSGRWLDRRLGHLYSIGFASAGLSATGGRPKLGGPVAE